MKPLRLAMLGIVDENGHPYSWSALFNGFDADAMKACPFPTIPAYLEKNRDVPTLAQTHDAHVTHIWTDDARQTESIARAARIPHIAAQPEDCLGQVDAVLIPTDRGEEHLRRARPFIEAGLPVFIDKPLCDNAEDLRAFSQFARAGKPIFSSSALRYSREFTPLHIGGEEREALGELRFCSITSPKSWERYGIHALEAIYPIFGSGFVSARNVGTAARNIVHLRHSCGADVCVAVSKDMFGGMGVLSLCGTKSSAQRAFGDTHWAFRAQMQTFVESVRSGQRPFPFSETEELMKLVIAGIWSRDQYAREVFLNEIEL